MNVPFNRPSAGNPVKRHQGRHVPFEGEDGLFTKSWFPICLSADVPAGTVKGYGFLDGRIVVFRGEDGVANVTSAFCPHLGADLCSGDVIGNNLRCAFHHWSYDGDGRCVATKVGDPPPATARLYKFVSQERYGIIWAFNGEDPHYDLPEFPFPEEELVFRTIINGEPTHVDPWVQCANTPDMQHIKALHNIVFTQDDPEDIEWTDHSMRYSFSGIHTDGAEIDNVVGIYGTSLYYQATVYGGKWFGFLNPMGLPAPGRAQNYMVLAARKDMGPPEEIEKFLDFVEQVEKSVVGEDLMVMASMKFRPGTLTRSDKTLAKFFDYMRAYPRAHPSADFI
ncbi:Rieske (2Fe-2S) protein [Sphingosinicella rhizophila]|uniref:Rieske (2Fe-2S) protein n=1 Tax=Sphingosinicella rhizophila TaxID=3050082 RepID=A0ABU3Q5X4_9SPHN|nr:Rieske (2Fe-2S) protein [Sphingosinicella sp. GR2756]MDT9598800.1 Rieske (2Fe-2S) protein [Sphingosinicella sp. GR2756]